MKKIFVFALALMLCVSVLASCGEKAKERVEVNPLDQEEEFTTDANGDLSVLLPIEDAEGKWSYSCADDMSVLENTKEEQIEDEDGTLSQYFVFASATEEYTELTLAFTYTASDDAAISEGYNVALIIPGDGMVLVSNVSEAAISEEGEETEDTSEEDDALSITEDGKLVVSLDFTPSTGYTWQYEIEDETLVKFVSEEVVSTNEDATIVGAPAVWKATFEGIATDGENHPTVITFTCVGPDGTTDTTYTASFLVLADGTIVC